ncbi:hypothetical protein [Accumulibacter sp.]|uniref:hypothetical protein n=1 Tax=Accumulibacter sp. TaxID=2053492 RepID=UPI002601350D|nr:hypothetical protein [Accumulibacter sp.]MCM8594069.1 hypothetical protein [Accumulibacter sp.]MDS4048213.1 hypothetical protein [Accumulibacter sp.]
MAGAHLFVDISAHGFGHLAQAAPVLNTLSKRLPSLRISVRSGLPAERLATRISAGFVHIAGTTDFGYVMHDATRVDLAASARAYREQHADWDARVEREARFLGAQRPTLVLTDVAYLPLAGAQRAGIPSVAMCSLNWAELFAHFYGRESWAPVIHRQMHAAYDGAERFLRLTPGMAMADLTKVQEVGPVAALGTDRRSEIAGRLGSARDERLVLVAFGGIDKPLPVADWPAAPGIRWLIPEAWKIRHARASTIEGLQLSMLDLLGSVDAVIAKPGYGTFAEAACNGTPLLYLRRENWPEQDCLIDWLQRNDRCAEIGEEDLYAGRLVAALDRLWRQAPPPVPHPSGAIEAAETLLGWLESATGSARGRVAGDPEARR